VLEPVVYFCWHCYGRNAQRSGPCSRCGRPIEAPPETSYVDRLLWALGHPTAERRMTAIHVLGARKERRAVASLRALATDNQAPYQAAAALDSLVAIEGADALRGLLERLAQSSPVQVRDVARRALTAHGGSA
jgi:HEAT repeat protein